MKILHCIETVGSGGVDRRRLSLVRALRKPEYEHVVLCASARPPMSDAFEAEGVRLIQIGSVRSILATKRYRIGASVIDDWSPDIIHGAVIDGYVLAVVLGLWKRIPSIVAEETSDPVNRRWAGHALAALSMRLADCRIAVSPAVSRYLVDTLRLGSQTVSIVNNGVAAPRRSNPYRVAELRAELGIAKDDLVIGSVGRMHDETHKRFGDLLEAFSRLPGGRGPRVKLVLVGDGRERPGLEQKAQKLGIFDDVIFAGFQYDVDKFYAIMDVFALASEREAFGLVNAEAMRRGLPVVATAVGGVPDVVADGQTGILVRSRDVAEFARALEVLLTDESLRQRMGEAGRLIADRDYSEERYVEDIAAIYQNLYEGKGSRRGGRF